MITKNDWTEALDAWIVAERERLGGPPTPEEVVAYTCGELAGAEAARVKALLVYYPELTPLLTVQKRHRIARLMPAAAGVGIGVLMTLLMQPRPSDLWVHPSRHELHAVQTRGASATPPVYELPADEKRYLLTLVLSHEANYPKYRIDIANVTSTITSEPADNAFEVSIDRELIRGGIQRVDVYGLDQGGEHHLESYRIRVRDGG